MKKMILPKLVLPAGVGGIGNTKYCKDLINLGDCIALEDAVYPRLFCGGDAWCAREVTPEDVMKSEAWAFLRKTKEFLEYEGKQKWFNHPMKTMAEVDVTDDCYIDSDTGAVYCRSLGAVRYYLAFIRAVLPRDSGSVVGWAYCPVLICNPCFRLAVNETINGECAGYSVLSSDDDVIVSDTDAGPMGYFRLRNWIFCQICKEQSKIESILGHHPDKNLLKDLACNYGINLMNGHYGEDARELREYVSIFYSKLSDLV